MKRLQKKFNTVLIITIILLFSNCTAWPAIAALLLKPGKSGNEMVLLLPGIMNPQAGQGSTTNSTPNQTPPTSPPTPPVVTPTPVVDSNLMVSTTTTTGYYPSGTVINIRVKFLEAVDVTEIPQFKLNNSIRVNYLSGTATDTLLFRYTVQAGNEEDIIGLDAQSQVALILNGGTIKSVANNTDLSLTLPAPGAIYSMGSGKVIVIDTTSPTVTSVNSSSLDGNYLVTQSVLIQVNFSETVNVTGTPQLKLETGASDAIANYTSGSGTSTLIFNYTVLSGHVSPDLDYFSTLALALNAGSILDLANNVSNLTLAAPGAVNSLAANKAIVIDAGIPGITNVTSSTLDGMYGVGQTISIQVVFDKVVIVTGVPTLTLETGGTDAVVSYASGSGTNTLTFTYTLAAPYTSADLDYISTLALLLSGGTIKDISNNNANLTLAAPGTSGSLGANKAIVVNTTTPSVLFSAATSNTIESITTITIPVVLSTVSALTVTVDYALTGGTATAGGVDYTFSNGTLTFAQGIVSQDIIFTVINDSLDESNETVTIGISNPGNATIGAILTHTYTILDDDPIPTVTFASSTSSSGDESSVIRTVVLNLSLVSGRTVTVTATDSGGTASSGIDYTAIGSPLTITFNPGEITKNINIPILQDLIYEAANETIQLTLSAPTNASLGGITGHTFTITDDDFGIVSAETMDADNNGKIDHYKITFSEAVNDSSFPGYVSDSLGSIQAKWLIGGTSTGVFLSHGSNEPVLSDNTNDAVIFLKFAEVGVYNTDSKPNITTTVLPDLLAVSAKTLEIISTSSVTEADRAKPVIVTNSGSSISTNLTVTFSEPVWGSIGMPACGAGGNLTASSITYSNVSGNGASLLTGMGADSCGIDTTAIFLANTNFISADNSTDTLAGNGNLYDAANNTGNTVLKLLSITAGPTITNIQEFDTNRSGKIDQLRITFSTNMTDSTITDIDASRFTIGGTTAIKVNTGTGIIAAPNTDTGTANDTIITLFTNDSTVSGTSALSVAFLMNTGKWMGNGIELQTIADLSSVVEDKAPPVILTAVASDNTSLISGVDSDDTLVLTFSEGTNKPIIDSSNIASILSLSSAHGWGTITSATWNLAGDVLTITFAGSGSTISIGDTVTIVGTITDTATVPNTSTNIASVNTLSGTFTAVDTSIPTVASVSSMAPTTVRVVFSKAMNTVQAATAANYKIIVSPASGLCSDSTNFTSSTQTTDFNIVSVLSISGTTYDITLSASQVGAKSYSLLASKTAIHDLQPVTLSCPNNADFTGNEQLKTSSAACVVTNSLILSFSKPVFPGQDIPKSAGCTTSIECQKRYAITGATVLTPTTAKILDGSVCGGAAADSSKVCITHPELQGGGQYTIAVANATDGDGFNNLTGGLAWASPFSIRNSGDTENMQVSPHDRVSFNGCGTPPQNFVDGPLASDPFGTGLTDFSYIFSFNNQVYLGPNENGTGGIHFEPDGSNPVNFSFGLHQDPLGISLNSAYGVTPSQLFPSFGRSGCTANSAGCGSNNQNGRGLFTSGTVLGVEYLFGGAYYSGGQLKDIYVTTDTDSRPDFLYMKFNANIISGPQLKGFMATRVFNNSLWLSFPDSGGGAPKVGYVSAFGALSAPNATQRGYAAPTGVGVAISGANFPAVSASCDSFTLSNNVSLDTFMDFNGLMYTGGGGCSLSGNDGGLVRGKIAAPALGTDLTVITPSDVAWSNSNTRFSRYLPKLFDFSPQDKAFPQMAVFQGKLFVARNTCENYTCPNLSADDCACPVANRYSQLWKCAPATVSSPLPATATACDPGDWTLVANNGSGQTSMGDGNNRTMSLLVTNGAYLYVGFDNPTTGVEIWRTNITNPNTTADFSQIGVDGLGDASNNLQIFDGMSSLYSGLNYLYLTTGKSGGIVKVYRQKN